MAANRPTEIRRFTFEDLARRTWFGFKEVVPLEAVAPGDQQVLATGEGDVDLDLLADFPSVESVITLTGIRATRELPAIRELFFGGFQIRLGPETLRRCTGLRSLYARHQAHRQPIDLEHLPAESMRQLVISRWNARNLNALERMTGLRQLDVNLFRESLELVAGMHELTWLKVLGPAKAWAVLRECTQLEEASFVNVDIANLKRWNTWGRLRNLCLGGRGIKSFSGLEACQAVESLFLLNFRSSDLAPLRELTALEKLQIRMAAGALDLDSIARVPRLRRLEIDEPVVTERDVVHLPTLKPLAQASGLEELVLLGVHVEDADLSPLAGIESLRRVRLGQDIGCDVEILRQARPDVVIEYTPSGPKRPSVLVGKVLVFPPSPGIETWSIFDNLATAMGTKTNYAAEARIRREIRKTDPELARRLEWDTEGGAVGIYAKAEPDIRRVAEVITSLITS